MKGYGKLFSLIFLITLVLGYFILTFFEPVASRNIYINGLKRGAAQLAYWGVQIYDPYGKRVSDVPTGHIEIKDIHSKNFIIFQEHLRDFFKQQGIKFKIMAFDNMPIRRSQYSFRYESYLNESLLHLKMKYPLEEKTHASQTDVQKLIKLGNWINQQWKAGTPQNVPFNFNALEIIERGNRGERFFCSEYATVFVQAALSLGFQARYVGLLGNKGHVVSEVWSDDLHKWFVIDNYFNVIYRQNQRPLNALEIHHAWCSGQWKDIEVFETAQPFTEGIRISHEPYKMIDAYASFYVRMRNDWYSNPLPHWHPLSNSIMNGIEYQDSCSKDSVLLATETSNQNDLYWDLNKTTLYLRPVQEQFQKGNYVFEVTLDTLTPDFKEFLIHINDQRLWITQNKVLWHLKKGTNLFSASSVNALGKKGSSSTIAVFVD